MWVCLLRVKLPVPTVIETGLGTSCGLAAPAAADVGVADKATTRPAIATRRETTRLELRRRVGIGRPFRSEQRKRLHCHPEAVRFLPISVYTHAHAKDKTRFSRVPGSVL